MHTIRKTIRTSVIGLIGASAMLLASCGNETADEQPAAAEAPETAETTTTEAPTTSQAPEEDEGDKEKAREVVSSLKAGDVVTHPDDAEFWGSGVVRKELSESKKGITTTIFVDFASVPTSEFTFEAEGTCIVVRPADPDFTDHLTYIAVPGFGQATWEIDSTRAAEEDREFEKPPYMAKFDCEANGSGIDRQTREARQAESLAKLEEAGFAEVGRDLRGDELEIVERAED